MKSTRRHELEKNELADWVTQALEGLEEHRNTVVVLAIGLGAAVILSLFFFSGQDTRSAADWQAFYRAYGTPNPTRDLEALSKLPGSNKALLWARKALADQQLQEGTEKLFVDRDEAKELLDNAAKHYEEVEAKAGSYHLLLAEAQLGLARVFESQAKVKEAKTYYIKALATAGKDTVFGKAAAEGLKRLADPRHAELLVWFQEQKPKPAKTMPALGKGLGFDDPLPDRPNIGFPAAPLTGPDKTPAGDPEKPGDSEKTPIEGDKPEGDAKPAEKPAPEEGSKPEGEKKDSPEPKAEPEKGKP